MGRWWTEGTPVDFVIKKNGKTIDGSFTFNNFKFGKFNMDWNKKKFVGNMYMKEGIVVVNFDVSKYRFCNKLVNGCFKKGKYSRVASKDGNFKVEVEKEDVKVMMMKLKFAPRTMDMEFFYPRFFQKTLNKPFETLTMKMMMDDKWKSCKVETNFENMKMEMTRAGGNMWKQTFHFIATR